MGACFDCLVEIDGVPNRQACMVVVEEAMQVRRAAGAREAGP
jgi:predicted molibdopterin-dependent oxidoreductase YjgC